MLDTLASTVAAAATITTAVYIAMEMRALRKLLESQKPTIIRSVSGVIHDEGMSAAGIGRMKMVGSVLSGLPRTDHNKLVAALSARAAPVSRWGPVLAGNPAAVRTRLCSLQTGDLVLTSTRVGSWVGNTVQVLTSSTWNHVAIVIRGRITEDMEEDTHDKRFDSAKKQYQPRTLNHFKVTDEGEPHLFEASWQGVHVYPNTARASGGIGARLLDDQAYEEYSTIAVRALQGVVRTSEMLERLEQWVAQIRGTAFEASASLHNIFSEDAGGLESVHCAELVTETLKVLGIVDRAFISGTAPPAVYADAPFGTVKLLHGCYGPMKVIKADDESADAKLATAEFVPHEKLRHRESMTSMLAGLKAPPAGVSRVAAAQLPAFGASMKRRLRLSHSRPDSCNLPVSWACCV